MHGNSLAKRDHDAKAIELRYPPIIRELHLASLRVGPHAGLLERHEYERWLHGSISDVIEFQIWPPMAADRIEVVRTDERWRSRTVPAFQALAQGVLL